MLPHEALEWCVLHEVLVFATRVGLSNSNYISQRRLAQDSGMSLVATHPERISKLASALSSHEARQPGMFSRMRPSASVAAGESSHPFRASHPSSASAVSILRD